MLLNLAHWFQRSQNRRKLARQTVGQTDGQTKENILSGLKRSSWGSVMAEVYICTDHESNFY